MLWGKVKFLLEIGVALSLTTAGLELFLRSSGTCQPPPYVFDERFGSAMKPNADAVFINEGFRLARVNEYGYLGPCYPPEKAAGTVRIALIGDSYVAGREVFDRHHFRRILEDELERDCGRRVEVLNLGFPTTSLERFYIYYEVFGKQFSPDYVLYFVGRNSLNWKRHELRPELVVERDSLRIDYSFRSNGRFEIRKRLQCLRELGLFWLASKARELGNSGEFSHIILGKPSERLRAGAAGDDATKGGHSGDREIRAVDRAVVRELGEMNRRGRPRCIIVGRDSLPENFLELLVENEIAYFDASSALELLAQGGEDPCYWKGSRRRGHWNPDAHRVVGEFLAAKMEFLIEGR